MGRVSSDANKCYRPQRRRSFNVFSFDAQTRNINIRQIVPSSTRPNEIRALHGEALDVGSESGPKPESLPTVASAWSRRGHLDGTLSGV